MFWTFIILAVVLVLVIIGCILSFKKNRPILGGVFVIVSIILLVKFFPILFKF